VGSRLLTPIIWSTQLAKGFGFGGQLHHHPLMIKKQKNNYKIIKNNIFLY